VDKGPWRLYGAPDNPIGVISDDFEHDVVLNVSGDFEGIKQKKAYCEWLLIKLNGPAQTVKGSEHGG